MRPYWAISSLLFFLFTNTLAAQQTKACKMQVAVSVINSKTNEAITDLPLAAFTVKSGNTMLKLISADYVTAQRAFILLDVSGSIKSPSWNWDYLMRITAESLAQIPGDIPVSVVPFAEQATKIDQRNLVLPYLQKLYSRPDWPLGKRTRLYDYLLSVAEAEKISGKDALIVITDGGDTGKADRMKVEREFRSRGVRPSIILLTTHFPKTPEEQGAPAEIGYLTDGTGGFFLLRSPQEESGRTTVLPAQFFAQALNHYRLVFGSSLSSNQRFRISVLDSTGRKEPKIEIRSADHFPDCQD